MSKELEWLKCLKLRSDISLGEDGYKYLDNIIDTLSKPSYKCCCGMIELESGSWVVDNVVHRKGKPCFVVDESKPSVDIQKELSKQAINKPNKPSVPEYDAKIMAINSNMPIYKTDITPIQRIILNQGNKPSVPSVCPHCKKEIKNG